jgi:hypothetical protein
MPVTVVTHHRWSIKESAIRSPATETIVLQVRHRACLRPSWWEWPHPLGYLPLRPDEKWLRDHVDGLPQVGH